MPASETKANKKDKTPDYDPLLRAFHFAFEPELRRIVQELPCPPDGKVLDLCCGDGFYTRMLAERLDQQGELTAADLSDTYLERAKNQLSHANLPASMHFQKTDAYKLPFEEGTFDLVWCAQSFISLEDPVRALKEMRRVLKTGGFVAILESDEYHHLLLPWPVELELSLQRAVQSSFQEKYGYASKAAPARSLSRMLRDAGLRPKRKKTYPADRTPPFEESLRTFLRLHGEFLREIARDRLSEDQWKRLEELTNDNSPTALAKRPDIDLTCLNVLYLGEKSSGSPTLK